MKYKYVVFDIDGTLIDSDKAIIKSLQKTLLEHHGVMKDYDELKFALGIPGKDALISLAIKDIEEVEEKWNENLIYYKDDIKLFSQIKQLVQALKSSGINLGIITSKTKKEYEDEFLEFGIHSYFDVVICADDTKKHKPNKEPMEKYLELTNAKKDDVIYVGDTIYDMQCAKNAGVDFALALWEKENLEMVGVTYKLNNPKDILDIITEKEIISDK